MKFSNKYILLSFLFSFAFTIAKSQDSRSKNMVSDDFSYLFQNVEKSIHPNVQAIIIPNSKQSFSGFDAAKAYSYIDKTKKYKNIIFVYSSDENINTKMYDKHVPIIKTWLNSKSVISPIVLNIKQYDKKSIEYLKSLLTKNNLLIISEDVEKIILASNSYSEINILNKSGSPQSNWKVLIRK